MIEQIRYKLLDALNMMALSPKPLQGRLADAYREGIVKISAIHLREEQRRHLELLTERLSPTPDKSIDDICSALSDDDAVTIALQIKMLFEGVDKAWIAYRAFEKNNSEVTTTQVQTHDSGKAPQDP